MAAGPVRGFIPAVKQTPPLSKQDAMVVFTVDLEENRKIIFRTSNMTQGLHPSEDAFYPARADHLSQGRVKP